MAKNFARSRESWKGEIASGFAITKLVTECYHPSSNRDDESFFWTMVGFYRRLSIDLIVPHPVTPGEAITKNSIDPKIRFLKDMTLDAITRLQKFFKDDCNYDKAMRAWNFVFWTNYFSE